MNKSQFNAMTDMQDTQRSNAWSFIFSNWHCTQWSSLPQGIKLTLGLHSAIGICSGMLVTRTGANGSQEFINRLNSKSS